jgi:hypothetical protein
MSADIRDVKRNIVPRWRRFNNALSKPEHLVLNPSVEPPPDFSLKGFEELQRVWAVNKTFSFAADLISAAVVLGKQSEVIEAARFVVDNPALGTKTALSLAERVLGVTSPPVSPIS